MKTVSFGPATAPLDVPALGLGTYRFGEAAGKREGEVAAVQAALDIGYRLIDTAEMYGDGAAESVVGAALHAWTQRPGNRRDDCFIVSKVLPHNASRQGTIAACERSLQRLGVDHIDLYLLHWPGRHPVADTVAAFEALRARGLIRHWGVSNFDVDDMHALARVAQGGHCACNQVYYAVNERGVEFELAPLMARQHMPLMAYSPIDQGTLASDGVLAGIGARLGVTAAQVALAWVLRQPNVIAIPMSRSESHLRENFAAATIELDTATLTEIDRHFPPPRHKRPLATT